MEVISSPGMEQGGQPFCTYLWSFKDDSDLLTSLTEGVKFTVDASPSTLGIPGHTLEYEWDFDVDGDGSYTDVREDYTYTKIDDNFEDGTRYQLKTITLTVKDGDKTDTLTIDNIKVFKIIKVIPR